MNTIVPNPSKVNNSPNFGMKFLTDAETQKGVKVLKSLGTGKEYREFIKEMKGIKTVNNKNIGVYLHSSLSSRNNLYASAIVTPVVPLKAQATTSMVFDNEMVNSSTPKLSLKSVLEVFKTMKQNLDKQINDKL